MLCLLPLSFFAVSTSAYIWPSPYDFLEDAYTVSAGFGDGGIVGGVDPCSLSPIGGRKPGRVAAAEWVRLAFHDASTFDIHTGLGGVDASIGFETNRGQNIGAGMNDSLVFFGAFQSKTSSMADVIALSAILAVKNCGGPSIPFRAGRLDAEAAGPETVPEPQQDLASHIASFQNQGFNVSEMITLVACGHTLGGVHAVDFPLTIPPSAITSSNPDGVVHFDDSVDSFDNHIATQYVAGTSTNPLLVGANTTTNSDARIFAADANQTMQAFAADPNYFKAQCGLLLERMLNTVPSSVQLSDFIEPLPIKPFELTLTLGGDSDGRLSMGGYIRVFGTSDAAKVAVPSQMPITLSWKDMNGNANTTYITNLAAVSQTSSSLWGSVHFFEINAAIDIRFGISSFVVDWAYGQDANPTHSDNGGQGFPLQSAVLFQPNGSCTKTIFGEPGNTTALALIRTDLGPVSTAYVDYTYNINQVGSISVKQVTTRTEMRRVGGSTSPWYDTYSATFYKGPMTDEGRITFDIVAVVGGKTFSVANNPEIFTPCRGT
ncbi:Peroxidase [Mycena indigotica]|uniref:Peroxidase n=1 Tax=Mycena indigotica TaxID=2126181 RepID=A0A8H6SLP8_9AGAR|nr:Peroxidase [Mycena indigotica]KAF7301125.1 Peroxidase [Mycena indigotica]